MGSTNAPGELTCNRSGCHTGNALDSGGAVLSVDLGNATGYTPGAVYPVTVELAENGKERFGFQMLALKADDSTNAGEFTITDSARTKIITGINQFAGRSYVTYKFPGTAAVAPGIGRWTFEWQAPTGTQSPISFYTAAAVANNDGTDQGDYVYTKVLTLSALPTAAAPSLVEADGRAIVYPNPSDGRVQIAYSAKGTGLTRIHLLDLATHRDFLLLTRKDASGPQKWASDLRGQVPAGTYLLTITQGSSTDCHTLILLP